MTPCFADEDKNVEKNDAEKGSLDSLEPVPYPKSVFFILSTEACERFSFYGMRGQ